MIPRPRPNGDGPAPPPPALDTSAGSQNNISNGGQPRSRSSSPERPPVSPISPVATVAQLAPPNPTVEHVTPPQPSTFIPQPASIPISESENPDAIALRSAISLLQLQREKSKRDLRTLEELKTVAVADPQGFLRQLQSQRNSGEKGSRDALTNTLSDIAGSAREQSAAPKDPLSIGSTPSASEESSVKFPSIPQPQDVFRCPPINWAKYHIVGEPLDKLHEEQRQRPTSSEPTRDQRQQPHVIAGPYSPFLDRAGELHPMQTRKGSKRPTP